MHNYLITRLLFNISNTIFLDALSLFEKLDGIYILGDALSHLLGSLHRQNYSLRTMYHITSGEHTATGGHTERTFNNFNISLLIHLDSGSGRNDTVGWS